MAFLIYLVLLILFFILISILFTIYTHKTLRHVIPSNWPILGMIPGVLVNAHRLHDSTTELLIQSHGTFMWKGPWLANMDMLLTTDPLDIHHILSKNFSNYPKGDKFQKIFDILGDGILNADGKIWEISHKVIFSVLNHVGFQSKMETIIWDKVENGLLPILESICERGTEMDLQDIFQRFAFDIVFKLLLDNDQESLSLNFPYNPYSKAFTDSEEAVLLRHVTPPFFWKLQQILRVGKEKKLSDAWKSLDQFIYKCLAHKEMDYNNMNHEAEKFTFFDAIMRELKDHIDTSMDCTKFLRDTFFNLTAAGKDTISSALCWFFYLLATNPTVEDKILEEMQTHLEVSALKRWNATELDKMVYLHGALCETLRLYPPVPFNNKSPLQPDILPSGHQVDQNTNIILSFYSMGRMESIWGEDCMEFKPERWISSSGGIKHVPSYKFPTFNAGPRACLGKNMAFSELKIVATTIIYHYQIQLVEGHLVLPADSMILHMKYGLKVKLNRRSGFN
ncbi:putative cytochrome P450 [Helianthus annuus]|nr:putative cytochrome P450 [Helianthus annuus]